MQQIIAGDCLEIMKRMKSESIDLVVTDPPYLINYRSRSKNRNNQFRAPIKNDDNPALLTQAIPEIYRLLKPNSALYCFCSPNTVELFKSHIATFFIIKNLIIWVKNNWSSGDIKAQYAKQYEIVIYANKGRRLLSGSRLTDVWFFNRVAGRMQLHQNQKPVDLIARMIEKSSKTGDVILDPFMGVGSTLCAAEKLGRHAIGIEIETRYCEIAKKRLHKDTTGGEERANYLSF